tara:strand:- start:12366 stop:13886 length:1521 start_codon:yes stop_codon:yes gene_type:complete
MAEFFGFEIKRKEKELGAVTPPATDDGTYDISGGGFYSTILDTDGRSRTEDDLIRRYRDIAIQPECDSAIEDIVSEAIASDERDMCVSIALDNLQVSTSIKKRIKEEFEKVLQLLDFNNKAHDIFRRWYVDGRLFYHKVIDAKNPRNGVQQLRYIDPRKIKKVREVETSKKGQVDVVKKFKEFYIYNQQGHQVNNTSTGVKLTYDSIAYCPSGLIDMHKGTVLSYLNKAIKPVNQLRMIEDSVVIYRISRAPERRIFYIDVGNLPKIKAEQYLKDVMNRYRNKLVYDASTGEIRDDRNHMSMLEDFWLPRREGGRGTEITTLPGGANLGEIDDITYFQRKLYRSLNVPISRLEAEQNFSLGRSTEITRDELKFTKFVGKLRKKFSVIFNDLLRTQLILTGVIAEEEWKQMSEHIQFDFLQDNNFTELKNAELLKERLEMLSQVENYVGTYFSKEWVKKNVLHLTDDEIGEMQKQIEGEGDDNEENGDNNFEQKGDGNEPGKNKING